MFFKFDQKKPSARYCFLVTYKILRRSITLKLLGVKLPKLDGIRNREKAYSRFILLKSLFPFINLAVTTLTWPEGTYGLPKANVGCPLSTNFKWATGWRFEDTEDTDPRNIKSSSFHLDTIVGLDVNRTFCIKINDTKSVEWPKG